MRRVFVDFPQPVIFTRFTFAAERKLPWPSVREEILHRRQHAPRFEETDAHPLLRKDKGSRSTACARPDHHYIIAFFAHGPRKIAAQSPLQKSRQCPISQKTFTAVHSLYGQ